MKQSPTRWLTAALFIAALAVTGFFVVVTYKNIRQVQAQNHETTRALFFLTLTQKLTDDIQELADAQRGYIFTSRDSFTAAHAEALLRLEKDTVTLLQAAEKNPQRKKEISVLIRLVKDRVSDSRNTVAVYNTLGIDAVVNKIRSGVSNQISDKLRQALQDLKSADQATINKANNYLEGTAQQTSYRFFVLSSAFFALLSAFLLFIYFDFKKENKMDEQLRLQASLINTIPDVVFTLDKDFNIKTWNRYAEELYGIPGKEAVNSHISRLFTIIYDEDRKIKTLATLHASGSYKDEYEVIKKNKEKIFVLASVSTMLDNNGELMGYVAVHRDISERKKLEDSHREFSRELSKQVKLQTAETINILERITDGFLALDNRFTFTFVNQKAGDMLGHSIGQMVGKNIFTDFTDTTSSAFNQACERSFTTQQYIFLENYYAPLDKWFENDIYPSPDGLSVFFKDITFKKNAETALKESEERYRHLIEFIHAGLVVHKPNGKIFLYNQEACRLLGLTPEEMEAKKSSADGWNFVSADGKKLELDEYPVKQVIRTKRPLNNMIAGIDNAITNSRIWVLVNAFPEFDDAMQLKQVVVTFVDITDRKKAEEELKTSEANLNMAQSLAKIGSWEFSFATRELKWTKELYRIYEFSNIPSSDLYEAYRKKIHPEDLPRLDKLLEQTIKTKKGYTYQHRILMDDNAVKYILGIGEVMLDEKGEVTGLKGTGQDITSIIRAEEKLENSYKEIKQLVAHLQEVREEERTNMAREIHDELGQQLTGLKMYISWLNKKVTSEEPDIREKFNATIELIEDTIKSVRKISMDLRPSMLDDLGLLAAMEWQSNEFTKRSGVNTEFINQTGNREIPSRFKTGLFRIYQESLTNVARHADAKKIVSSLKFDKGNLVLTITDDGKGFAFKNVEGKKTLGIFGMKERTMEMGGKYEIKSEPGRGTTVSVTIPLNLFNNEPV